MIEINLLRWQPRNVWVVQQKTLVILIAVLAGISFTIYIFLKNINLKLEQQAAHLENTISLPQFNSAGSFFETIVQAQKLQKKFWDLLDFLTCFKQNAIQFDQMMFQKESIYISGMTKSSMILSSVLQGCRVGNHFKIKKISLIHKSKDVSFKFVLVMV